MDKICKGFTSKGLKCTKVVSSASNFCDEHSISKVTETLVQYMEKEMARQIPRGCPHAIEEGGCCYPCMRGMFG